MGKLIQIAREKLGLTAESTRPDIQDAIELVLDNSCPKIRLIRGHKKKLKQPVESALSFIAKLIETLPGPLDVTSDEAYYDVLVKTFFVNEDQLKQSLANDPDLNEFLSQNSTDLFFVLLTMDREVKTIFGSRLKGEIVLRDVALKAVNFSEHKFRAASVTMADFNQTLERGVLQILAHWSLENVLEEQSRKEDLSQLREEVAAKLKILAAERQQMVLEWRADSGMQSYNAAQKLLEKIENELNVIKTKSLDTDYYLGEVTRVLSNPNDFFTAEHVAMHFDRAGILLDGKTSEEKDDIRMLEVKLGDNFRRSCVLLKCSRNALFKKNS
ncbi:MAG: hypothetical protein PVH69_06845 [Desulfobacterales bacterium]